MEVVKTEVFDPGNTKFRTLLRAFEQIIEGNPKPEQVKDILQELKDKVKNSSDLTARQVESIVGRCDNYIKGEYGNTKKPEHYEKSGK